MNSKVLRRTLQTLLSGAMVTLAACSTPPMVHPEPIALESVAVLPVTTTLTDPAPSAIPAAAEPVVPAEAKPPLRPADYSDLFDRIRAGFKLPDSDHPAIDRELEWYAGNPDYLGRAFSRADLYLYHIVTELEARGMPLELAMLPVVESAFEPYAYSHSSASGLWQFIPGTGSRYNLKQDWWYDGRRDVLESTRAALDYLQALNTEFNGDWLLAIAAYNCGEMNVERAIARNQAAGLPTDFWNLKLPAETRAYVPKLLAMGRVVAHPERYGLAFNKIPNQPYFAKVDTKGQISMHVAAEIAGLTDAELYELNPAFHRWATDPSGPFSLLVPADTAEAFRTSVIQLTDDQRLNTKPYSIRRGDTVNLVARHFRTTAQDLRELNNLPKGALLVGTALRVPSESNLLPAKALRAAALVDGREHRSRRQRSRVVVRRGETLWAIAHKHGVDVNALALMNGMQPNTVLRTGQRLRLATASGTANVSVDDEEAAGAGGRAAGADTHSLTHIVHAGDTLFHVAQEYHVSVAQVASWNRLSKTRLVPGQKLVIHASAP
ncbi:MAG TPA: LysM peptidoglycan-binding domain-containing protein [Steroidobacteraceae bacterium]|nr:LysM peptidoglycan-binding domain-containing protein [Steroidobacteraceae bacterium]